MEITDDAAARRWMNAPGLHRQGKLPFHISGIGRSGQVGAALCHRRVKMGSRHISRSGAAAQHGYTA
jgi:D-arabinose 5-phosphate isomerase GutQ